MEYKQLFEKVICKKPSNEILNPIDIDMVKDVVCKRKRETHKGDYGRLLIVGGSEGMTGAPCMSAMAAMRCGCGLVTVACPRELNPIFEIKLTEAAVVIAQLLAVEPHIRFRHYRFKQEPQATAFGVKPLFIPRRAVIFQKLQLGIPYRGNRDTVPIRQRTIPLLRFAAVIGVNTEAPLSVQTIGFPDDMFRE
jgi:hypothetical protein